MVTVLSKQNFDKEVLQPKTPVIVDFWASWCGPCKMLAPVFEELSHEFNGRLKFAKLSTEEEPEIASEYEITGVPCLILFNQGEEVERVIGYSPKAALKQKIEEVLKKIPI